MISDTLQIVGMTLAVLGWGQLLASRIDRLCCHEPVNRSFAEAAAHHVIYGFYAALLFGQVATLAAGTAPSAGILFLVAGIVFFFGTKEAFRRIGTWRTFLLSIAGYTIFCLLFIRQVRPAYDAGLYHLSYIRWMAESGTVLGLANLHGRLGFNSSWLSAAALFAWDSGLYRGAFDWSLTGNFLLFAGLVARGGDLLYGDRRPSTLFASLASAIVFYVPGLDTFYSVTSTDIAANLLVLHAFTFALVCIEGHGKRCEAFVPLALSIATAITIKLSVAPVVLLLLIYLSPSVKPKINVIDAAFAFLPAGVLIGLWLIRNVMLSGCFAYPIAITCLALPWSVDLAQAVDDAAWIKSTARVPGLPPNDQLFDGFRWLASWTSRNASLLEFFVAELGLASTLIAVFSDRGRALVLGRTLIVPIAAGFVGILFWFLIAPDLRFGSGMIVAVLSLTVAIAIASMNVPRRFSAAVLIVALCLPIGFGRAGALMLLRVASDPDGFEVHGLPQPKSMAKQTASGLIVQVPSEGDQCWLLATPCTPYFKDRLTKSSFNGWPMFSFQSAKNP